MTPRSLFAIVAMVMAPVAVAAQDGPAFDCAKAESSAEKLICTDPELAALDRRLARHFEQAVAVAQGLDAGTDKAVANLRAYQRGWISGRDECWKASDLRSCVEMEYLGRDATLVAEFMLEEPTAVTEFFCDPAPMSLTVYQFATELPGLRVEVGDRVEVGAQVAPDAPGAFYLRQAGGFTFTDSGGVLHDAYGTETECRVAG